MNRERGETGKISSNTEKSKKDLAFDNNMNPTSNSQINKSN